jgi:2-dehydropantoate 2-reductase
MPTGLQLLLGSSSEKHFAVPLGPCPDSVEKVASLLEANMRHAILGAGGVGGLVGAALAKSGDSVTVVLRPEALINYPTELSLESPFGSFSVAVERATEITQRFDVLWLAVKATHLDAALRGITNAEQVGTIVPLLNGIDHVALLRSRFGHDHVVPATIAVESERAAPGKIIHRSPSVRLSVSSIGESRLATTIEKLRQFGFTCQFSTDEQKMLWNKLAILAPCALATAASGMTMGEVKNDPVWRKRMEAGVYEACAVASASGIHFDPAGFIRIFDSFPPGMRSSMQKDVAAGDPPELDGIAGPILRRAQEYGLEVPVTRELVEIIRGKSTVASRS